MLILFIFLISCSPVDLSTKPIKNNNETITKEIESSKNQKIIKPEQIKAQTKKIYKGEINKTITVILPKQEEKKLTKQFTNIFELALFNLQLENVRFDIKYFENQIDLRKIIETNSSKGKIFFGPLKNKNTKLINDFCDGNRIFFSFASDTSLAKECIYLVNFFPRNELHELFNFLDENSKVALLFPENNYGYFINSIIDDIVNSSEAIIVNRSSYKNDLSNVRDSIRELGKYELRKYELDRQKIILSKKTDNVSKQRLKKLQRFKTTSDYEFTHILIADYGLNLLKVVPLLPYYDIDPNIVQFMGTGVIDDKSFFYEPSLQGTIFPGAAKDKRIDLKNKYQEIYDTDFLRILTLPYDLVGLINFIFSKNYKFNQVIELLSNQNIKFDGVDGNFNFQNNVIERDLKILKIQNGDSLIIN
tara:strand:+ start:149 stop:1405 length:1257 start_codon:yes stop_codon:yes gene_type:complete